MANEHKGRQKGTPNKKTRELIEIADKIGVDPFEILLDFAAGNFIKLGYEAEIEPAIRAKAAAEACQYLYPKRKAIEHSTTDDGFRIVLCDYLTKDKKP